MGSDVSPSGFTALHVVLTKKLVDELDARVRGVDAGCSLFFDEESIEGLGEFVEALQGAMSHRIVMQPNSEIQDWAVDYRGGLHRLLWSFDAPLRCAVGLFKEKGSPGSE
jgi:hypothetical protein